MENKSWQCACCGRNAARGFISGYEEPGLRVTCETQYNIQSRSLCGACLRKFPRFASAVRTLGNLGQRAIAALESHMICAVMLLIPVMMGLASGCRATAKVLSPDTENNPEVKPEVKSELKTDVNAGDNSIVEVTNTNIVLQFAGAHWTKGATGLGSLLLLLTWRKKRIVTAAADMMMVAIEACDHKRTKDLCSYYGPKRLASAGSKWIENEVMRRGWLGRSLRDE